MLKLGEMRMVQPKIVRLEAERAFTEIRQGTSSYFAHVYRIDEFGGRQIFADAYGSSADEALANAEGIARVLNASFGAR